MAVGVKLVSEALRLLYSGARSWSRAPLMALFD